MSTGAGTPEELESMLEDAVITRDPEVLTTLFEEDALLIQDSGQGARGRELTRLALSIWQGDHAYVADPRRVIQARDIALILTASGVNVARRGSDGTWRYVVVLYPFSR